MEHGLNIHVEVVPDTLRGLPNLETWRHPRGGRRLYELVAPLQVLVLPELLDQVAQHAALGVPVDQPRAHLLVHGGGERPAYLGALS
jgi:hypothetical protein